jgi:hypothetical protein
MTAKIELIQDFLHRIPELQAIDRVTFKELCERLQP